MFIVLPRKRGSKHLKILSFTNGKAIISEGKSVPDEEVICFGDEEIFAAEKEEPEYVVLTEEQFKAWKSENISSISGEAREIPNITLGAQL